MPAKGPEHVATSPGPVQSWIDAMNRHDADRADACFAVDYEDEAPARRGEHVKGRAQVRENFERLFGSTRDLRARLLAVVQQGNHVWIEWSLLGRRVDGSTMEFAGVNIFEVRDGLLARGRIYTELVREAGGLARQLERMTHGPGPEP